MVQDPVCLMEIDPTSAGAMTEHNGHKYYFCSNECRDKFTSKPGIFVDKAKAVRFSIGVMGSAGNDEPEQIQSAAYEMGRSIAQHGYILITGACPGLPYECARGAREHGGLSVGISPALSLDEHVHKYLSPSDVFDVMVYTGSGLMGREVTNIRSSDMVVILGGRSGTLGEFAIAYDEGKLIGVLEGSGGITEQLPAIVASFSKDTGAKIIYQPDPRQLIDAMVEYYSQKHYRRPSCFCHDAVTASG